VEPHETPTKLRQGASFYGIPASALGWLLLAAVVAVAAAVLSGAWVALLVADRWTAIACRLALGLALGGPVAILAAPGVLYGHSLPRYALVVLCSVATPRLTIWRAGAPCPPVALRTAGPTPVQADRWGAEREDWS
jgi:hypothetical protein